jgi:hypothetical protein
MDPQEIQLETEQEIVSDTGCTPETHPKGWASKRSEDMTEEFYVDATTLQR